MENENENEIAIIISQQGQVQFTRKLIRSGAVMDAIDVLQNVVRAQPIQLGVFPHDAEPEVNTE